MALFSDIISVSSDGMHLILLHSYFLSQ